MRSLFWMWKTATTMTKWSMWLLLFMDFIHQAFSVINDGTLHRFCTGSMAEFPGGLNVSERIGEGYCVQLVPKKSTYKSQAKKICQLFGPFRVYNAVSEGDKTRCYWGPYVVCHPDEVPFQTKCLKKLPSQPLASAKTACGNGSLLSVSNRMDSKWLLKLHARTGTNLWVSNGIESSGYMMPSNDELGYSNDQYTYDKKYTDLSLVGSNDFELYVEMGMLIPSDPLQKFPSFCSRYGIEVPVPPAFVTHENTFPPNTSSSVPHAVLGNLTVFLSGPFSFNQIDSSSFVLLDVNDLYEHCGKYGKYSFLLVPSKEVLTQLAANGLFTGPAFVLGYQSAASAIGTPCDGDSTKDALTLRPIYHTHDGQRKPTAINTALWETGYPKRRCSKYPSVAVVVNKHGKLENFPSNARLPVVCASGVPPAIPASKLCPYAHSDVGPNGKCRCVDGTTDITHTTLANANQYPEGHFCMTEKPCSEGLQKKLFFFLLLDDVLIESREMEFVTKVIDLIPDGAGGGISRFRELEKNHFTTTWDRPGLHNFMKPRDLGRGDYRLDLSLAYVYEFLKKQPGTDFSVFVVVLTDGVTYNPPSSMATSTKIKNEYQDATISVFGIGIREDFRYLLRAIVSDVNEDLILQINMNRMTEYMNMYLHRVCREPSWEETSP